MAFISNLFFLDVALVDKRGKTTHRSFQLSSADYAAAVTDSAAILTAVQASSFSVVSGYDIREQWYNNAFGVPATGNENSFVASISGRISGNPKKSANFTIPNPQNAVFVGAPGAPGALDVNLTNALVLAYAALFQTGGEAFISDGEILGALIKGEGVTYSSKNP